MNFTHLYGIAGLVIILLVTLLWILSLILKNASIVDIFWGAGFVISCWIYYIFTPQGYPPRKWLLASLVTLWGVRLSAHILVRNWGNGEDFRYRKWREEVGPAWWWQSYFRVFLLQGLLMWVISSPLLAAQIRPQPATLTLLDMLAPLVWLLGFFFEAVGDWQLTRFKNDPGNRGKVLQSGVWRYTRHPNYFGDAAQWWAFYLLAAGAGGYSTILSPILMTFLLLRVSGVTLLEKTLVENRPGYKEYVGRTSAFIPWFPRSKS